MERIQQPVDSRRNSFLAAFLAPLIWGFMALPIRALSNWRAEDILGFRILMASAMLWLFIICFRKRALQHDLRTIRSLSAKKRRSSLLLTLLASLLILGNWYTYIYAVNHISIQSAAFAYMLCPLITTFTAYFVLGEQLSPLKWVGLALAFISVCMLSQGALTDLLWSITIAALYAVYLVIQRVVQGFDKLNQLAIQLLTCGVCIVPVMLVQRHPIPTEPVFWVVIALIALVFTIVPLFLSMYALKHISSTTVGILLYINPIIAFLIAIFYFNEALEPYKYIAYGVLFIGILVFNGSLLKKTGGRFFS